LDISLGPSITSLIDISRVHSLSGMLLVHGKSVWHTQ